MMTLSRLTALWDHLGLAALPPGLYEDLIACYCEPHRKYHTLQHLDECLEQLDNVRDLAERPDEIEIALWFHDCRLRREAA